MWALATLLINYSLVIALMRFPKMFPKNQAFQSSLPEFLHLKGLIGRQMRDFSSPVAFLLIAYPFLRYIIPYFQKMYNL